MRTIKFKAQQSKLKGWGRPALVVGLTLILYLTLFAPRGGRLPAAAAAAKPSPTDAQVWKCVEGRTRRKPVGSAENGATVVVGGGGGLPYSDKIHLILMKFNDGSPGFCRETMLSAMVNDMDVHVHVATQAQQSVPNFSINSAKLTMGQEILGALAPGDMVIWLDAFDTVVQRPQSEILDLYYNVLKGPRALVSTEVYCFPKELETLGAGGVCTALDKRAPANTASKYMNMGGFMGRADELLVMLKETYTCTEAGPEHWGHLDQAGLNVLMTTDAVPELKPDYYSDIFHSVHQVMHELVLVENPHPEAPPDADKIYMHWKTKRIPAFLHFNGNVKDFMSDVHRKLPWFDQATRRLKPQVWERIRGKTALVNGVPTTFESMCSQFLADDIPA